MARSRISAGRGGPTLGEDLFYGCLLGSMAACPDVTALVFLLLLGSCVVGLFLDK